MIVQNLKFSRFLFVNKSFSAFELSTIIGVLENPPPIANEGGGKTKGFVWNGNADKK